MRARQRFRPTRGQSTVEYMLLISFLVLLLWGVARSFTRGLESGLGLMSRDVQTMSEDGYVGGGP
jgi:hypothetical protein